MTTKPITKPAPLGRGLSALFGDSDAAYQARNESYTARSAAANQQQPQVAVKASLPNALPITWIQPGAFQPRRKFDDAAIKELADSIRERGIFQPLIVRAMPDASNSYEIIAGERRWRAAQLAGLHEVPVIVRAMTDREAMEIGLIENVQRQDLSPLEEAEGYRRLIDEFNHQMDELGKVVGKSRSHINNMVRLLTLPLPVKQMIESGQLTFGHARSVIAAENPTALAQEIVKKGLNVRQAEALAKRLSDGRNAKRERVRTGVDPNILALEKELERAVGLKVRIQTLEGQSGTVTLHYNSLDQLDGVVKRLRS